MDAYYVYGKAIVEVCETILAESEEEALKLMNEKITHFDSSIHQNVFCDEPIKWTHSEKMR